MISDSPEQVYIENYALARLSRRVRAITGILMSLGLVAIGALTYAVIDTLLAGSYYVAIIAITLWLIVSCLLGVGIKTYWIVVEQNELHKTRRDEARKMYN